jgi:hypothetical protein
MDRARIQARMWQPSAFPLPELRTPDGLMGFRDEKSKGIGRWV